MLAEAFDIKLRPALLPSSNKPYILPHLASLRRDDSFPHPHRNKEKTMFFAMNRFKVRPEEQDAFRQRWLERDVYLKTVPGFVSFHLLRGPVREDHVLYISHTLWASHAAFEAWTRSEQFRAAHAGAGGGRALTIGHPEFEGFKVLQEITAPIAT